VHGGDEVALLHGHGELDGIEVPQAVEAAAQIRAGIDRRARAHSAGFWQDRELRIGM
jgi:hypothetical protein